MALFATGVVGVEGGIDAVVFQFAAGHARGLMERAYHDPGVLDRPIGEAMDPPLPAIGIGEPVAVAVERLEGSPAVLVLDGGHPIGVLTRADVLNFLAQPTT